MNDEQPSSNGVERVDGHTESLNSILVECDGPEDTTVRPSRFDVRQFWPKDVPFPAAANNHEGIPQPPKD